MQQVSISFNAIQTCPMCKHPFDGSEKKYPRIMTCGHSICSQCIKNEIRQKKSVKCHSCNVVFSKEQCAYFKLNHEYVNLIQFLEESFGKSFAIYQKPSNQKNEQQRLDDRLMSQSERFGELIKCKNPGCLNKTDLIFCSAECQAHYDEVQTKKNEGGFQNGRFSD